MNNRLLNKQRLSSLDELLHTVHERASSIGLNWCIDWIHTQSALLAKLSLSTCESSPNIELFACISSLDFTDWSRSSSSIWLIDFRQNSLKENFFLGFLRSKAVPSEWPVRRFTNVNVSFQKNAHWSPVGRLMSTLTQNCSEVKNQWASSLT